MHRQIRAEAIVSSISIISRSNVGKKDRLEDSHSVLFECTNFASSAPATHGKTLEDVTACYEDLVGITMTKKAQKFREDGAWDLVDLVFPCPLKTRSFVPTARMLSMQLPELYLGKYFWPESKLEQEKVR